MTDTNSNQISGDTKVSRRAKWLDIALSAFIVATGLGWVADQFFVQAQRELLADRCLYSMSATANMSSERISEEVSDCAEFLGWGGGETFFKVLERLAFSGWVVIAVTIFLALAHKRLSTKRFGRTFGNWLDRKLESRRQPALPPPVVEVNSDTPEPNGGNQ